MTTDLARQAADTRDVAVADPEAAAGALAEVLATGDLAKLTNEQRVAFYLMQCQTLQLNPYSRPFDWLILDGRLVLYPNKSCAEQLRRLHQIRVRIVRSEPVGTNTDDPMFVVRVEGTTPSGRFDEATKYVPLTGYNKQGQKFRLSGRELANAYAKAETGAKRRLVLSMVGLASPPDPDEARGSRFVTVDGTGRILEHPTEEERHLAEHPTIARAIGAPTFEDMAIPDSDVPDQRIRPGELETPKREGPRPTFRARDEDIKGWLGAWFGAVKGLSLDSDEARHKFVAQWTADEWPKAKRTDSLRTAFARMTAEEAGDFLAHVRALMDAERAALMAEVERAGDDDPGEPEEAF